MKQFDPFSKMIDVSVSIDIFQHLCIADNKLQEIEKIINYELEYTTKTKQLSKIELLHKLKGVLEE